MALDAFNKRVYISYISGNSLTAVDYLNPKSLKVAVLKTGKKPSKMAINLDNQDLYVVNYGDNYLSVFDKNGAEKPKIELGKNIMSLALNSIRGLIFAVAKNEPDKLMIYNLSNNRIESVNLKSKILGLSTISKNDKVYASQLIDGRLNLAEIDSNTKEITYYDLEKLTSIERNRRSFQDYRLYIFGGFGLIILLAIGYLFYRKRTLNRAEIKP